MHLPSFSRRDLLVKAPTLSVAAVGLLTGLTGTAFAGNGLTTEQDIDVLNVILGTEHEGIAAYQICGEGKLYRSSLVPTFQIFQDHHKKHRDMLAEKVKTLGGKPATAKSQDAYAKDLDTAKLKSHKEAMELIMKLERGAANAYIGMLPSTNDHELIRMTSRIAADEVLHWTTLTTLLQLPPPTEALSFGA